MLIESAINALPRSLLPHVPRFDGQLGEERTVCVLNLHAIMCIVNVISIRGRCVSPCAE
jgi:hypothetical protein